MKFSNMRFLDCQKHIRSKQQIQVSRAEALKEPYREVVSEKIECFSHDLEEKF